jgi:mycothione reductase
MRQGLRYREFMTARFDLVILGTGSANSILGPEFDSWKVAIIEEGTFGGTCLNRGCIPTKMLVHVADLAESIRHGAALGLDGTVEAIRWRDIRDRVFANRIDPIAAGGEDYRSNRCPNVTVFRGHGEFVGAKQIRIGDTVIEGEQIVVAVGARPMIPDVPGIADVPFHTSDDIMRIDAIPARLAVLGGGFIASELAHVFGGFGSEVTMINRGNVLLRQEDHEVAQHFTEQFAARFDLRLGAKVTRIDHHNGEVTVSLGDGSVVVADALLVSTGRIPNSDTVNAGAAGLAMHPDGRIVVDANQRTNVPGVWALGDVSSPHMLKHVANHEARVVQHNLLHPEALRETDHRFVPHAVFTRPQIAGVGMTERDARATGADVMVSVCKFGDTAYGWAMEDTTSFCKLIADRTTRRLLGAHMIGPHSAILIQQLIQGMAFGQTVDEMARGQYYIHPALPEVVENALLGF